MYRSFWLLILEQTVILPAMSNYFLSYTQIIGPWSMTDAKWKPCNQKQELPMVAMFVIDGSGQNEQSL
jgi:hypothetical protein